MLPFIAFLMLGPSFVQGGKPASHDKAPAFPPYTGPKKRVAVSGFDVKISNIVVTAITPSGAVGSTSMPVASQANITPGTSLETVPAEAFGTGLSDVLVTTLIDTKRFIVLERQNLADVSAEIDRGKTPAFANDSMVAEGKLLGAQVLFRAAITELSYKKSGSVTSGGIFGNEIDIGSVSYTATTGIELKMIDVSTGQILDSVHAEGKVTSKNSNLGLSAASISFSSQSFETSPLGKSVREAIRVAVTKVCERTDKLPWEAKVASVSGQGTDDSPKLLYLNFGKDAGIAVGTDLDVFKLGAAVIDPDSKVVIGREEDALLGHCKVRTVNDKLSIAVFSGTGLVEPGCGVRIVPIVKKESSVPDKGNAVGGGGR